MSLQVTDNHPHTPTKPASLKEKSKTSPLPMTVQPHHPSPPTNFLLSHIWFPSAHLVCGGLVVWKAPFICSVNTSWPLSPLCASVCVCVCFQRALSHDNYVNDPETVSTEDPAPHVGGFGGIFFFFFVHTPAPTHTRTFAQINVSGVRNPHTPAQGVRRVEDLCPACVYVCFGPEEIFSMC